MPTRARKKPRRRTSANVVSAAFYRRLDELTAGMTLAEIGRLTKTHPETVRRFVEGLSKPGLEWVARLCRALGVSMDWLVLGKGRGPKRR